MIPRIFHQIWVGPDPFPDDFARYQKSWRRHHPDWELWMWTEENLPEGLRRPEVYERLRVPAERSDILRLEVLWRHGGVYLDADFECRQPLDSLIEGLDFFVADLRPGRINNAIIGSVPGHPILDRAIREVRPRVFHGHDKTATGPWFLDDLLKDYPEVESFPAELFYPNTPAQRDVAVAIHHAARSWKDAESLRTGMLLAEGRLARAQRDLERTKRHNARLRRALGRRQRRRAKFGAKFVQLRERLARSS